jgi:hypothetical protein
MRRIENGWFFGIDVRADGVDWLIRVLDFMGSPKQASAACVHDEAVERCHASLGTGTWQNNHGSTNAIDYCAGQTQWNSCSQRTRTVTVCFFARHEDCHSGQE